jgi:glutamine---fructose-6-phosphate transaminase (isomerizing)
MMAMTNDDTKDPAQSGSDAGVKSRPAWLTDAYPELRLQRPWVMEEMIAAGPSLVRPILADPSAAEIAQAILAAHRAGQPIVTTGCGTSEHGAMAVTALLNAALRKLGAPASRVECRQALEAYCDPRLGGVLLAVSHEGGTAATLRALEVARAAGAKTILLTARKDTPATRVADLVLITSMIDRSWCHTVAYVSAIIAGAAVAARLCGEALDAGVWEHSLRDNLMAAAACAGPAEALASCSRLIVVGAGADLIAARELSLKIEEGAWIPTTAHHLETLLHGHLAATDARTGLVMLLLDSAHRQVKDIRAGLAAAGARRIGIRVAAILPADSALPADLFDAGRVILPTPSATAGGTISALAATLAAGAAALQQFTLALVHRVGCNPDLIRREQEAYREGARLAEQGTW